MSDEQIKFTKEEINEVVAESDNDSVQTETDEVSEELPDNLSKLTLKEGTARYIVTVDGEPRFACRDVVEARRRMWDIARLRKSEEYDYDCYIRECDDQDTIEVVGCLRFAILLVDRRICELSVRKVMEIEEVSVSNVDKPGRSMLATLFG